MTTGLTTLVLADDVRDEIQRRALELGNPESGLDRAMTVMYKALGLLPDAQVEELLNFGRYTDTPGVMLVDNLPLDRELPPTPDDGGPSKGKQTFVAESVLVGLSGLLGEPVSFLTEKDGRIVHDVVPTAQGARTQTSQGSKVFLNFHNDIVHDGVGRYDISNPDFLVLNCLRSDRTGDALTYYADARDILRALDQGTVEVLRSPLFQLNAPGGYTRMFADGKDVYSDPVPILTGPDHAPEITVAANGVRFLTAEAEQAFELLQRACRAPGVMQTVHLKPGQALLINNRKGIHARSQFEAEFDGLDRWLQRTYVRRSLWNIRDRACPGSRRTHR
ncbi:TauD/TfdA family dioxygenase [Streptosporangium algeriense]|uniref:TauD/TfdA family dioxygenase n=1 Tax=Streptosporangium algeriense TaxID=1682748 RepID=A0ABW3DK11_9ACTN